MSQIKQRPKNHGNTVGNSIGERRKMQQMGSMSPQRAQTKQAQDAFVGGQVGAPAQFDPNAQFRSSERRFVGAGNTPHRLAPMEALVSGKVPVYQQKSAIADNKMVNFLDKVIGTKAFHSESNMKRAVAKAQVAKK